MMIGEDDVVAMSGRQTNINHISTWVTRTNTPENLYVASNESIRKIRIGRDRKTTNKQLVDYFETCQK